MSQAKKFRYLVLIVILIVIVILLALWLSPSHSGRQQGRPITAVLAAKVKLIVWQPSYQTVGGFFAREGITITPQVSARVAAIDFHSGQQVRKGQLLLTLESYDLQAQLAQQQAKLVLAELNFQRFSSLKTKSFVSNEQYDQAKAQYKEAQAGVAQIKAQLAYHQIKAPFSGVIGLREVSVGQLLEPGNVITHLQQLNPIYLDFIVPQALATHRLVGVKIKAKVSIAGETKVFAGKVLSIDSQLSQSSRTMTVRAQVANPEHMILPGMFAEVSVPVHKKENVLVVPASAISTTLYGSYIFTIHQAKTAVTVKQVSVDVVAKLGEQVIIQSPGIKAGNEIVKMGAFKLRNDETVRILAGRH